MPKEIASMVARHYLLRSLLYLFVVLSPPFSIPLPVSHALGEPRITPEKGQMVISSSTPQDDRWPIEIKVSLFVEVPPQDLWEVLTDYDRLTEFVPHLKHSEVIARKGNLVFLDQEFGHLLLSMDLILKVEEEPTRRVVFERYGGNMKTYEGEYRLEETNPGGTVFTLEVRVEPDFFVPQKVMEWILKSELPKGLMAMRERALLRAGVPEPDYSIEVVSRRDF